MHNLSIPRPRDQTQQKTVRKVISKKDQWEAQKHGQELSEYHVPDIKKRIENQVVPANMVQINNNATPNQRPDSINIQKQNSISRKDSQKQNHQHDISSTKHVQNGPVQIPYNKQDHIQTTNQTTPQPNHMSHDVKGNIASPQYRPLERPPGPPVIKDSPSGGRDILPPPPPPPPEHVVHQPSPYQQAVQHQHEKDKSTGSPHHLIHKNSAKNSPARHPFSSSHTMDQSMDLPPPPLSPKDNTPDTPVSLDSMPPPPSPPPPLDAYPMPHFVKAPSPPPPPPPPPPPMDMKLQNGHLKTQTDVTSISSTGSTITSASCVSLSNATVGKAESDRSALLEEIRIGTRLKKMKHLEEKEEKKKMPAGRLDVQAIMDKAFEMRRRVIEDSESEEEEADSDENDW